MEAAPSKKSIQRAGWQAGSTEEDARAYLQARLALLSRLLFFSFIALLCGMVLLYRGYPDLEPARNEWIYRIALLGLVVLGTLWRFVLRRYALAMRQLYLIDAFYGAATGAIFASATYLASDLKMSATANILWSCFTVFLRAIVVPSTGTRTAIVSSILFVPMVLAAIGISYTSEQELPPPALIGSTILVAGVVILLATIGSRIIYGLRRKISETMHLGQYTLDGKIGVGGNGEVYRARHALLRRPTAIKLIRPDKIDATTLDRFEREVQHMSQLTHPNTVAVFDYGRSPEGTLYYAMEFLDGINLEKLVTDFGPQPADRVVDILAQVCGSLHEAHRRNIIHRDIKPANIILCTRGDIPDVAKVVDFGLAKELAIPDGEDSKAVLGTPPYIAPEAVSNPEHIGAPVDLYAVGAVGYYLLTGRKVHEGKTAVDTCIKTVTDEPVPPSSAADRRIPPEVEALVLRCLAKRPGQRPASAAELEQLWRALPAAHDWSKADAALWWNDFQRRHQPTSNDPTRTMTINLGKRVPLPASQLAAARRTFDPGEAPLFDDDSGQVARPPDEPPAAPPSANPPATTPPTTN